MTNLKIETSRQLYARLAGFTFLFYIAAGLAALFLMNRATDAEGTNAILLRIAGHTSDVRTAILLELCESFSALVLAVTSVRVNARREPRIRDARAWPVAFAKACWVLSASVIRWDCCGLRNQEQVQVVLPQQMC